MDDFPAPTIGRPLQEEILESESPSQIAAATPETPAGDQSADSPSASSQPLDEIYADDTNNQAPGGFDDRATDVAAEITMAPANSLTTITLSAVGDLALGGDHEQGSFANFMKAFEANDCDYTYFLRNVKHIFDADDLTIGNLEGALTEAADHKVKTFSLSGPPHFAKILSSSGVDVVSIANNHTHDFFEAGYKDTAASLEAEDIGYFGNEFVTIIEVKGIRVGLLGFTFYSDSRAVRAQISSAIKDLQSRDAQLIIAYYHWGREYGFIPDKYERDVAHFSIDNGADLVLGSHPHVIRGIESYKGKNIVYSLGNFCFGANRNPADRHTFIYQYTFTFDDGVLMDGGEINIIPAVISSARSYNNYQPRLAEGEEAERILRRIDEYSEGLK